MKDHLKKQQLEYFSGKSWMYAVKFQLIYDILNKTIVNIFCDKGKVHDFQILKNSKIKFSDKTIIFADSSYQGLQNIHKRTLIPFKKSQNNLLTKEKKEYNKTLSKTRITVEHVFSWLKRFKILVNKCRKSKLRLMYLRFNLICELFNKVKPFHKF